MNYIFIISFKFTKVFKYGIMLKIKNVSFV